MDTALRTRMRHLPKRPGAYLFRDARGDVLYVGKARSLKHRVSQYLAPTRLDPAKRELMARAADVETIVTKNEAEALALEATLIREHDPPYNVRLADDSSYLYVRIPKVTVSTVELVRKVAADGAWYRGPYPVASAIRRTLKEARKFFPWCAYGDRPLAHTPTPKPCFAYHLGLCPGICAGKISVEEYQQSIENLKRFLDGDVRAALGNLRTRMAEASAREDYERAAKLRDAVTAIEKATMPVSVATPRRESADALGLARRGNHAVVAVLSIRHGQVIGVRPFPLLVPTAERSRAVLRSFLLTYIPRAAESAHTLLLPEPIEDAGLLESGIVHYSGSAGDSRGRHGSSRHGVRRLTVPRRGWKRRLLELARANAEDALRKAAAELESPSALSVALRDLASALGLPGRPRRIEAYDISNIQGTLATGSLVVFVDGKPKRSAYRKFKITLEGTPDDTAMMREVLTRRFSKHLRGNHGSDWPQPDLILLDGGKGQLAVGLKVLKERALQIPIAALAKREEELFLPGRKEPILLARTSPALFLLQRIRDEAHRFTLAYHQLLRKKRMTRSILEEIPGVGDTTRKKLLRRFGSLRAIKGASREELASIVGPKLAETINGFLAAEKLIR